MGLVVGDRAPDVQTTASNGQAVSLADYRGQCPVVVFFYPRDHTAVCTQQACRFRDDHSAFQDAGAVVIGISSSSDASHESFADQHKLPYLLISDADGKLRRAFGVPRSFGFLPGRVTYVIDRDGIVRHVFNALLDGEKHVQESLAVVQQLAAESSP